MLLCIPYCKCYREITTRYANSGRARQRTCWVHVDPAYNGSGRLEHGTSALGKHPVRGIEASR